MDSREALRKAKQALEQAIEEKRNMKNEADRQAIVSAIGTDLAYVLEPLLNRIAENSRMNVEELKSVISEIRVAPPEVPKAEVTFTVPEIKIPEIVVPEVKIPEIKLPKIVVPKPEVTVNVPETQITVQPTAVNFPEVMKVLIEQFSPENPLPVRLIDRLGNPYEANGGTMAGTGGGRLKVTNQSSTVTQLVNADGTYYDSANPLPITGSISTTPGATFYASDAIGSTNVIQLGGNSISLGAGVDAAGVQRIVHVSDVATSVYVKEIFGSLITSLLNGDNRIPVSVETGGSGLTDSELRAAHLDVQQLSGSVDSVYVTGIFGTTFAGSEFVNSDNRLRVSVETGGSGLTDSELRATAIPVSQVSGANWSVVAYGLNSSGAAVGIPPLIMGGIDNEGNVDYIQLTGDGDLVVHQHTASTALADDVSNTMFIPVNQNDLGFMATPTTGYMYDGSTWDRMRGDSSNGLLVNLGANNDVTVSATNLDIRDLDYTTDDVSVYQVSGSSWSTEATQSGTWNIGTVTTVTGVTNSIAAALIDSSGVQYSTTNPLPIGDAGGSITVDGTVTVSGSPTSMIAVGSVVSDAADDGSAPVKQGGIARTANPTAVANGDNVSATFDDLGRQISRPVNVRDLITTAYVSLATGSGFGTETTLLGATAGSMYDLIYIMGSNDSDAAVSADVRGITAGNVLLNLRIPANGTAGVALPVPLPQTSADTGNAWTVDLDDVTGTNVKISALFTKEV